MADIEVNKFDKGDDFIDSLKEYVGNVSWYRRLKLIL